MSKHQQNECASHAKTAAQIQPGAKTGLVWPESSLSTWKRLGSSSSYKAHSEDWSYWADAQADLSLLLAPSSFSWFRRVLAHTWSRWRAIVKCGARAELYSVHRHMNFKYSIFVDTMKNGYRLFFVWVCSLDILGKNPSRPLVPTKAGLCFPTPALNTCSSKIDARGDVLWPQPDASKAVMTIAAWQF